MMLVCFMNFKNNMNKLFLFKKTSTIALPQDSFNLKNLKRNEGGIYEQNPKAWRKYFSKVLKFLTSTKGKKKLYTLNSITKKQKFNKFEKKII